MASYCCFLANKLTKHPWKKGWTSDFALVVTCSSLKVLHIKVVEMATLGTGSFLSEALILASVNPKYDDRLFVELQVQYKKTISSVYDVYIKLF